VRLLSLTLTGSIFTHTRACSIIIAVVGVPGVLLGTALIEIPRFGRKWAMVSSSALMGVSLFLYSTITTPAASVGFNAMEYFCACPLPFLPPRILTALSSDSPVDVQRGALRLDARGVPRRRARLRVRPRVVLGPAREHRRAARCCAHPGHDRRALPRRRGRVCVHALLPGAEGDEGRRGDVRLGGDTHGRGGKGDDWIPDA
jgi:hypothetical protein